MGSNAKGMNTCCQCGAESPAPMFRAIDDTPRWLRRHPEKLLCPACFRSVFERRRDDMARVWANVMARRDAWRTKECQAIYQRLLNAAGGPQNVRPGMRGQAKQAAITAYLQGKDPDFDRFGRRVELANDLYSRRDFAARRFSRQPEGTQPRKESDDEHD